jgi:hypothetical protein
LPETANCQVEKVPLPDEVETFTVMSNPDIAEINPSIYVVGVVV